MVFLGKKPHKFQDRIFISFSTSFFLAELTRLENSTYIPVVTLHAGFFV